MRLTLRTLLAYLDDMLEDPAETKAIGQKLAESAAAQELVARIKQVTRRRRLTTPPATGPGAFEPNTVAEYLDNELPPELVADVEKACLESDVHLAEIAAVHQILTLVVGQPLQGPPTAKQRMYNLVGGRGRSSRRAAAAAVAPGDDGASDDDETMLLGLPLVRRGGGAARWLLPLAALLLVGVLGIAVWQALPDRPTQVAKGPDGDDGAVKPGVAPAPPVDPPLGGGNGNDVKPPPGNGGGGAAPPPPPPPPPPVEPITPSGVAPRPAAPSALRREVGRLETQIGGLKSLLVSRSEAGKPWQRLASGNRVHSGDALVSLPGYRSEVRLDTGVAATLWGNLPEFLPPLYESAATFHVPGQGFDADLSFDRGGLLLTNHKTNGAASVRLRFLDQVWDVTLQEPATQVGVTLWGRHVAPHGSGEAPHLEVHLFALRGTAAVKILFREEREVTSSPQPSALYWDNRGGGVEGPIPASSDRLLQFLLNLWKAPPAHELAQKFQRGLDEVSLRLSKPGPIETGLAELLEPSGDMTPEANRRLAVRALAALDDIDDLINALEDPTKPREVREEAIFSLRHWIGRGEAQENRLYDPKENRGLLSEKRYTGAEAVTILSLLHSFTPEQVRSPETYDLLILNLRNDRLAIRELAYFHLLRLAPAGQNIRYDPTGPTEMRDNAFKEWKKLIPDGKLPPPPPAPGKPQ